MYGLGCVWLLCLMDVRANFGKRKCVKIDLLNESSAKKLYFQEIIVMRVWPMGAYDDDNNENSDDESIISISSDEEEFINRDPRLQFRFPTMNEFDSVNSYQSFENNLYRENDAIMYNDVYLRESQPLLNQSWDVISISSESTVSVISSSSSSEEEEEEAEEMELGDHSRFHNGMLVFVIMVKKKTLSAFSSLFLCV